MADGDKVTQQIKDLAGAASTQAHLSNRIWTGLATVAVISLLPQTPVSADVSVPGLGKVPITWFHLVVFALLIVLAIAFASAHAQHVRAQDFAHQFIKSLPSGLEHAGMHSRALFDMLSIPGVNRVSPLAMLFKGKYPTRQACPICRALLACGWYILLKMIGVVVYFGVPAFALVYNYKRIDEGSRIWRVVIDFCGSVALLSLLQVLVIDLWRMPGIIKKAIWREIVAGHN